MKISCIIENDFRDLEYYKSLGINDFELCTHEDATDFLNNLGETRAKIIENELKIVSLGRWGAEKVKNGEILDNQIAIDMQHIDFAHEIGCNLYCTGINYDNSLSLIENYEQAINYFKKLIEYGSKFEIQIAVVNCDWNNYILGHKQWAILLEALPELKIKYDASHLFYRDKDYLAELEFLKDRVAHVHLKGSVKVDNKRYDDPPAGLDQIDWNSILTILYVNQYNGYLSIEPHAEKISREITKLGVGYTLKYFSERIIENE